MYEGPGIYRHYKGGHYRVIGIGENESGEGRFVVYHSYSIEHDISRATRGVNFVLRPLNADDGKDAFNVPVDGQERFTKFRFDTYHVSG